MAKRNDKLQNLANDIAKLGLMNSLESVSLVVTASEKTENEIIRRFQNKVLKSVSNADTHRPLKELVKYFIDNEHQVTVFPKPKKLGKIDTENAKTIQKVVERVAHLSNTIVKPSISEATINAVYRWGKVINENIKKIVELKTSEIFKAIRQISKITNKYSDFKKNLKVIKDKCDAILEPSNNHELINTYQEL